MAYLYLIVASAFQLAWLYNIKLIKKESWKQVKRLRVGESSFWIAFLPIILYVVFGVSNVVFLTKAMNFISASFAYAVWTGIVIGASSIIDQVWLKKRGKPIKFVFLLLILIGIIGLRYS